MNTAAMQIPIAGLIPELERRIAQKTDAQEALDTRYGKSRIRISSYMENIGWPELFGYEMNHLLEDAEFSIEQNLRQKIFWLDNVADDGIPGLGISADVGLYWDMTLFGMQIRHTAIGVPEFQPHPFQRKFDRAVLGHFDFYTTGVMPKLIAKYQRMQEISRRKYGGKLPVGFPCFHRGPLDIYVQLRGYENFLEDIADRPDAFQEAMVWLVDERCRFAQERQKFLGENALPATSFIGDDWVNIPFISPDFFRASIVPIYQRIRNQEGPVSGFHTCGNIEAIAGDLLRVFPEMQCLEVSGWNDVLKLDAAVGKNIRFTANIINTVSLGDALDEQRSKLDAIRRVSRHRDVTVCVQAMVKLYPTYEETLARWNRFLNLAREELVFHGTAAE